MGGQRVLFGTDFPFPLGEKHLGRLVQGHTKFSADTKARLLSENARQFFGLT
jgi:aminocarboxymuconate-semialdehyde decarboxylase